MTLLSGHSPFTVKDIETIESVQRRFTKRLPGLNCLSYAERLKHLHSLELRRLYTDYFIVIRSCLGWLTYRLVISLSGLLAKTLEATSLSCTRKDVLHESGLHFSVSE